MKLIVVFCAVLLGCFSITIGTGDRSYEGVSFGEGFKVKVYDMGCLFVGDECKRRSDCCDGSKCIGGICAMEEKQYQRDEEVVAGGGKQGVWYFYDKCSSDKKRLHEKCTKTKDCCEPNLCISGKCSDSLPGLGGMAYAKG